MKKHSLAQVIVAGALCLAAVVMIAIGAVGYLSRGGEKVRANLDEMRSYAVLRSSVSGLISQIEKDAKRAAKAYADENNFTRNQSSAYLSEQAALARADAEQKYANFTGLDTSVLSPSIDAILSAQEEYHALETVEKAAYAKRYAEVEAQAKAAHAELNDLMSAEYVAAADAAEAAAAAAGTPDAVSVSYAFKVDDFLSQGKLPEAAAVYGALDAQGQKIYLSTLKGMADEIYNELAGVETTAAEETTEAVDTTNYSFFIQSAELDKLEEAVTPAFDTLWNQVCALLPEITEDMKEDSRESILDILDIYDLDFAGVYDQYATAGGVNAIVASEANRMNVARNGDTLFLLGAEALMLGIVVYLWRRLVGLLGVPRLILIVFFVTLCIISALLGINVPYMLGNILKRTGMFGVLALAMLPGIQCGIGLNLGMTVGCIAGLLSTMIVLNAGMTGPLSFLVAIAGAVIISVPLGWGYGQLLNRVKGDEMTISTYVGFSFVSLMCVAWMLLPFRNPKITWILGSGLRVTHNLSSSFGGLLNNILQFKLFGATVPTGLLLFLLLSCFLVWLFQRSKTGTAMIAAGSNPRFAEAAGVNVNKMRMIGTILSTVIAAIGIIVYAQSLGYAQLYNAPRQMGFISASAILIGGASVTRGKVSHVIIGTFLFQGVLALGLQVANAALSGGGLSEITRIMISNGIILYALTQSGGESRA